MIHLVVTHVKAAVCQTPVRTDVMVVLVDVIGDFNGVVKVGVVNRSKSLILGRNGLSQI